MKKTILITLTVLLMVALVIHSTDASLGAATGISYSLGILVPSLFPFMILSSYLSKLLKSPNPVIVFILSILGGYPISANMLSEYLSNGEAEQKNAEYILYACINPSISFMVIVVGKTLLQNMKITYMMIAAIYLSSAIIFTVCMLVFKPKIMARDNKKKANLLESVYSSSKSIFMMCILVIVFCSLEYLLYSYKVGDLLYYIFKFTGVSKAEAYSFISGFLEISGGTADAAMNRCSIAYMVFILSFGGICVHFQIFSIIKKAINISKLKFFLYRVIHASLAVIILQILKIFIKVDVSAISTVDESSKMNIGNVLPGTIALIILSIVFVVTFKNKVEIVEKV